MSYRLKQGRKGLELHGRNMVVEEGSPKFNQLIDQLGDSIVIEEPSTRMAGEDKLIQEAIAYLQKQEAGEIAIDSAMNDAMEVVRISNYNRAMAKKAGIPKSMQDLEEGLLVKDMANGVPMPIVRQDKARDIEKRIHTERVVNPVTGVEQVVPFINEASGAPLITELGFNVNMEGQDKASEYIQDHLLRLAGFNPTRGPKGKIDFFIEKDGKSVGIDGQTSRTTWNPSVQAYSKVIPKNRPRGDYGSGYARDGRNTRANEEALVNDVRGLLRNEMDGSVGLKRAMNNLIPDSIYNDPWLRGKAYRDSYDEVIMPVYKPNDHLANKSEDLTALPPEKVVRYEMNDVRDKVDNIKDPNKLTIAYNAAANKQGEGRAQISVDVPRGAKKDMVKEYPYMAQLLSRLQ